MSDHRLKWKDHLSENEHHEAMREQDRVWKERRMISGHGAQDGSAGDPDYKALIVVIAGPIKHWWDENWMSPDHLRYDEWRTKVEEALIAAGFLVYKPYTAFKGTWNEQAQEINNAVVKVADVLLVLTPKGVPSEGTDAEMEVAKEVGTAIFHFEPPPTQADDATLVMMVSGLMLLADNKNGRYDV